MNALQLKPPPAAVHAQGFSMIEVLVTLLIISLALLGTAGLQAFSMRQNQGGQFRSQAVFLVADLAERMEANKRGAVNAPNYLIATSSVPNVLNVACSAGFCSDDDMADFDMSQWQNAVAATLPGSTWTVTREGGGNLFTYTIRVSWEDRLDNNTTAAFDAATGVGGNAGGTGERFFYTATRTVSTN